jgi:20S proteasome subunit alpha 7
MVEPSGVGYEYYGAAAGRGRQPARTEMEKLNINPNKVKESSSGGGSAATGGAGGVGELITVAEGVKQLAKIIHSLHDEAKDKPFELEMSWLCEGSGWKHVGVPRDVIAEAVEWAKKEVEDDAENDEDDDEMEE